MKIRRILALALCLILLSGCGHKLSQAVDGTAWGENWTVLGTTLGVEEPKNGFVLSDNSAILAADDTYYATWTNGEPSPYVNAEGKDTDLYTAQIYLLLVGCKDAENAGIAIDEWMQREESTYIVSETTTETYNGQEYTVLHYDCGSATNPYSRGVSAFAVFENYAVSAELTCTEGFDGDVNALLAEFLNGCHYAWREG
ncbi:MAG: hypothetical protein IJ206_12190 [Oscillospiraceae bacterium]|nr:hypothetical protein [Oscillospiraceae bacterium]